MDNQTLNKVNGYIANPVGGALGELNPNDGGTIWNHQGYENYNNASLTEQANQNVGTGLDPFGMIAGLWNDITGTTAQSREFAQQEYLQDKMNEYNTPAAQMARMKAAGINPNLAASGIAGGGNESAQAPSVASNVGGVANGLGSLASVAGAVTGGIVDVAGAALAGAEANKINETLPLEKNLLRASTYQSFMNGGYAEEQAIGLSIENLYRGEQCRLDISTKLLNLDLMQSEIDLIDAQYFTEHKKWDLMKSELDLNKANLSLTELKQQTELIEQEGLRLQNWYKEQNNSFRQRWNFDPQWSSNAIAYGIMSNRNLSVSDKKIALSNLLKISFYSSFVNSHGAALGSFDASKALINAQAESNKSVERTKKNLEFRNKMGDKWIRVPSSATVGPFHMVTE